MRRHATPRDATTRSHGRSIRRSRRNTGKLARVVRSYGRSHAAKLSASRRAVHVKARSPGGLDALHAGLPATHWFCWIKMAHTRRKRYAPSGRRVTERVTHVARTDRSDGWTLQFFFPAVSIAGLLSWPCNPAPSLQATSAKFTQGALRSRKTVGHPFPSLPGLSSRTAYRRSGTGMHCLPGRLRLVNPRVTS